LDILKRRRILIEPGSILEVHDPFSFFCTAVHSAASRQGGIHGMQGVLEKAQD